MTFSLTLILIIINAVLSFMAFNNRRLLQDLIFHPPTVIQQKQYYRFITSGFIHADLGHLAFNMITLYFFGTQWEYVFVSGLHVPGFMYLILYFSALIIAHIPSFIKHKNDYNYYSLGASGAVSAIVFSMILLAPWSTLYVFFLPLPAIIFALLYIGYSIYMERRGGDNINHGAHLWGAAFGVVFTLAIRPEIGPYFIRELFNPSFNF